MSSDDFTGDGEITRQEAMSRFHVRLADGRQVSGARGFVEVWRVVPSWSWLARLARGPGILPALELLYRFFLRVRPLTVYLFKGCRRVISRQQSE